MTKTTWTPADDAMETSTVGRFIEWTGRGFENYDQLLEWSVTDLEGFWGAIADYYEVDWKTKPERVLGSRDFPGAVWFPGGELNYAEHLLRTDPGRSAVVSVGQGHDPRELSMDELRAQVARARAGLKRLGVGRGDRVVAYLPNVPETLIAFAACASLGAVWASCAPELGPRSVIDRLSQLDPKLMLTVDGYHFRDKWIDRSAEIETITAALPTLERVLHIPAEWDELTAEDGPLEFDAVPFDHPLYVLFSSGTTGIPKAIVHGHGGILIEHLKAHSLSWGLEPGGRLLWFSTTSWMMWNTLVSSLLVGSSMVMIDGDPAWPDLMWQWRIAEQTQPTFMGASVAYAYACRSAGLQLRELDLASIEVFGTAGSPMPVEGYRWVAEQLPGVRYLNGSGGTDICSGIVGGSPIVPVWEGEISANMLGCDAVAFDANGQPVVGELGELVIRKPMPSMPVKFWGDDDGSRLHAAYFEEIPGVWRQGDWIRYTEYGSSVVTGRSDATLNRGGVRLGTGEFYGVVEDLPEVADSLVVHLEGVDELMLFVVLSDAELDDDLRDRIKKALRGQLSPRHSPDTIVAVPAIPRTLTGKKLEAPVKRILQGTAPEKVASQDALLDPTALDSFVDLARDRGALSRSP
jgi:acetoacetyl-CoA synthetase